MSDRVSRFNRVCLALAALWLAATVPLGLRLRPTDSDFPQFYMGGLLVRLGETKDLYPIPNPQSFDNPGMNPASKATPRYWEIERRYGVPDITHWMLPPPSALPFVPLSYLPFRAAEGVWVGVLAICVWTCGVLAGRTHRVLYGAVSRWEGVLALGVVLSPMAARAIRIRNCTPPIAVCFAVATLALIGSERPGRAASAAASIVVGALMKYATLALLPLVVLTRRWRTLVAVGVAGALVVAAGCLVMSGGLWRTYFTEIAPKLHWPSTFPGNQTIPGFLVRWTKQKPLATPVTVGMYAAQVVLFAAIVTAVARRRGDVRDRAETMVPAAAALVAWVIAFSPSGWEHWPIWLAPFWGWLVVEGRRSLVAAVVVTVTLALMYVPLTIFTNPGFLHYPIVLGEPWNSSQLAGVLMTTAIALASLWRSPVRPVET